MATLQYFIPNSGRNYQKQLNRIVFPLIVKDPILHFQLGLVEQKLFNSWATQVEVIDEGFLISLKPMNKLG